MRCWTGLRVSRRRAVPENQLASLKAKVDAVLQEIDLAIAFHETWRPMVEDTNLHQRIGTSFAANSFSVIRTALRRELLLALVRVWDKDARAVNMVTIANILEDQIIAEALADEVVVDIRFPSIEWRWLLEHHGGNEKAAREAGKAGSSFLARDLRAGVHSQIQAALTIIRDYDGSGSSCSVLEAVRTMRHEHLAYHQLIKTDVTTLDEFDNQIEAFYQDMLKLTEALFAAVKHVSLDLSHTAKTHTMYAALFWNGARGERTEGHPDYRARNAVADMLGSERPT